jgi:hypothetical protein
VQLQPSATFIFRAVWPNASAPKGSAPSAPE